MTGPVRPKYADRVEDYSWTNQEVFGSSPVRLARFYGDTATLDGIAAESDAQEVAIPVDKLNTTFGQNRSEEEWLAGFAVG